MKLQQILFAAVLLGGTPAPQAGLEIRPAPLLDLGEFPGESAPVANFELVNAGSNTLRIVEIKSGCTCFEPILFEKEIPPGASTPMDVFINGNLLSGHFEKKILLRIGGETPTNAVLKIKGTSRPAILDAPKFVFTGRTAFGQSWETNILLHVRQDLTKPPTLRLEGNPELHGELKETQSEMDRPSINLHLRMPPQTEPFYWEGRIILAFRESPAIPPILIKVNGYSGGTLHPSPNKIKPSGKIASFILQRTYPTGATPSPAQIQCSESGVAIQETPLPELGKSRVELIFSETFIQQLQQEDRITIPLSAKGFIPTTLVVEP